MEAALLIAFREGLEAFLILGLLLAYLQKSGLERHKRLAWGGAAAGALLSVAAAVLFTVVIDGFESEELQYLLGLGVLAFAIVLLTTMLFWMQENAEAARMREKIRLSANQKAAVFLIALFAVVREGLETVLFMLALTLEENSGEIAAGVAAGLAASALLVLLVFKGSASVPLKPFFRYSSYLIMLIVAGLSALLVRGLQQAEYLPLLVAPLFDSSALLPNDAPLGQLLGIVAGYDATPSLLQFAAWSLYLGAMLLMMKRKRKALYA